MKNRSPTLQLISTAIALLAVLGLIWYLQRKPPTPETMPTTPTAAATADGRGIGALGTPQSLPGQRLRLPQTQVPGVERIDAAQRALLIKQIQDKLLEKQRAEKQEAAAGGQGQSMPGSAPSAGKLDKEYIRDRMQEIVPLVKECFEMNYDGKTPLEVKLVAKFVIEGADELGGIVTSSEIVNAEEEKRYPDMAQCVRETMYALRMKAPEGGGVVVVSYPFKFSAAPETQPAP